MVTFPYKGPAAGKFGFVDHVTLLWLPNLCGTTAACDGLSENGQQECIYQNAWGVVGHRHSVRGLAFMTSVPGTYCNIHKYNLDRRQPVTGIDSDVSSLLQQVGLRTDEQCGNEMGLSKKKKKRNGPFYSIHFFPLCLCIGQKFKARVKGGGKRETAKSIVGREWQLCEIH